MKLPSRYLAGALMAAFLTAEARSATEWEPLNKTLYDLIAEGYELKAVLDTSARLAANPNATIGAYYFLQKGAALARCREIGRYEAEPSNSPTFLGCQALTKPQ